MTHKYVLTGGPGVGKTTMLEELGKRGYQTIPEAARLVIETEHMRQTYAPTHRPECPPHDFVTFQDHIYRLQVHLESENTSLETVVMDRSMVDNLAYMELFGQVVPDHYTTAIENCEFTTVFLLEPLAHYVQDSARKETREEAVRIHKKIREVYTRLGHTVVSVPDFGIEERCDYIHNHIKDN